MKVSLGTEERQIVAGLQKYYKPEDLIGKKIVVVANLKPVKLKGIESQGMVIAAGDGDVVKVLVVDDLVAEGENIKITLKSSTQAITIEPTEADDEYKYFYMILPVRMNEQK